MEAGECGLTREACFVARRHEVVAVAGLLWISWCVLVRRDFVSFFRFFFLFERTRPAASMTPPCLIYLSTSNEERPRESSDRGRFLPLGHKCLFIMGPFFAFRQKSLFIPECVQGAII